jgi:hypothetical protein
MEIRIRATGAVITESEFRQLYKNISFPPQLSEELINYFDGDVVFESATPETGRYEIAFRDGVQLIGNKWFTKYSIGPVFQDTPEATAAQQQQEYRDRLDNQQASSMRSERNRRLSECDWTVLTDSPVNVNTWSAYRQSLRDVPDQAGFPWDVQWPTKPE